jgi:hypothetical protein
MRPGKRIFIWASDRTAAAQLRLCKRQLDAVLLMMRLYESTQFELKSANPINQFWAILERQYHPKKSAAR